MASLKQLAHYSIVRRLGSGGMGEVYLGFDTILQRHVALKVLSPQLSRNIEFVERFRNEADVQSKLIHPNIIRLLSYAKEDDVYYMVLEYVEGTPINKLIASSGAISEQHALFIFKQMLEGIDYLHFQGLLHRDINPRNVILDENEIVKLLDFGISKGFGDHFLDTTEREIGTLYYLAPELFAGNPAIDARIDIYSLGITLYEMLTGRVPFSISINEESDEKIKREILKGTIPDPRVYNPLISHQTVTLLWKMIEKQPSRRAASCKELLSWIETNYAHIFAETTTVRTPQPTIAQQSLKEKYIRNLTLLKTISPGEQLSARSSVAISSLAFSPESSHFASGNMKGVVHCWDVAGGNITNSFSLHTDGVTSLCFSPDGQYLASAGLDKNIILWYRASSRAKAILRGHTSPIMAIRFSKDGTRILSGSFDNSVKIWDVELAKELKTLKEIFRGGKQYLTSFAYSSKGNHLAGGWSDAGIKIWELNSGKEIMHLQGHTNAVYSLAFSPDDTLLASGDVQGTIKVWDTKLKSELFTIKRHTSAVLALSFAPNGKNLASGSTDNSVKIWNIESPAEVVSLQNHSHDVTALTFSHDGKHLVTGDAGSTIIFWEVEYE
ncbi:MAG: serine/threonine protein kinase [Ignavibacteriales bacterium]|nr:serine/threonine protein kinase [Ignavibacteriales bacterium]